MKGQTLVLGFAGFAFAWIVFFGSGVQAEDRNSTLLLIGAVSFFYWLLRGGQTAPPLRPWHAVAVIALPCYLLFQLIPFPPGVLETLSPARAQLTDALAEAIPNIKHAPISVTPAMSLFYFFGFLGFLATFLLVRDIAWRFTETQNWAPTLPLIIVAAAEALVGLSQIFSNASAAVRGSFADRDHLSGFLEMVLPLSLVLGYDAFRRHRLRISDTSRHAIFACGMWGVSGLMLAVILKSGSAAGPLILFISLASTSLLLMIPHLKTLRMRFLFGGALLAAILVFFVVFPPTEFADHLSDLAASDKSPGEQLALWKEMIPLLAEFRWFGTGLGGFESSFLKYQGTMSSLHVEFAHNDYLHYLIEIGILGFSIFLMGMLGIVRSAVRGLLSLDDEPRRLLAAAGIGCFIAVSLRSAVDSNLAVPANAMALAWISGLVSANGLE
jgi:O-antigen ligase